MRLDETVMQSKTAEELIRIIKKIHDPKQSDAVTNMTIKRIYQEQTRALGKIRHYQDRGKRNQKGA